MSLFGWFRGSQETTNILPTDVVVFIVGPSGSGKRQFMTTLLQNESVQVRASQDQKPGTPDVHAERCRFDGMQSDIVIVDTAPLYACMNADGEDVMKRWMDLNYTKPCKAAGALYMLNLVINLEDADLQVSNHVSAFRRTCRQHLIPSVIRVVPALPYGETLSAERVERLATQLQRQTNPQGAQLLNESSISKLFDGKPETAWDVVQGLVAALDLKEPEVKENDYVIFVVGPAGAGKTWVMLPLLHKRIPLIDPQFTRRLSKNHDMGRHPYSEEIEEWTCNLSNSSRNIIFVDLPSFHTEYEGFHVKNSVMDWLDLKFTKKCHSGILFLHSLDSDPTRGDMLMSRHLETFANACPNKFTFPTDIYVVPTSSPNFSLPSEELSQRLLQLKDVMEVLTGNGSCKWRASMFPGVFKGQPEMAWSAALLLLKDISQTQAKGSIHPRIEPTLRRMPPQLPNDRLALGDLTDLLLKEFGQKEGRHGDLDAIITLGRIALEFSPAEHRRRHSALINLSDLLSERFKKEGSKEDLDELITLKRAASKCSPENHPRCQTILLELDDSLYQRFKMGGAVADLEEIISLRRAALEHTPPPDRCRQLLNLANSLHEKFQKHGLVNDINDAISLACSALGRCPPGHPDRPLSRDHLANYLKAKVRMRGVRAHASDTSNSVSSDIKQLVKKAFLEKAAKFPLRLLHTPTGMLCNRDAQLSHFENSLQYQQLLLSTSPRGSQQLENEISDAISEFFGFAMLSHRWGSGEPSLRNIEGKDIYDLGGTDGLAKLQAFCILALERDFHWAWSDTCCIDKDSSAELHEAIGSMFSWYRRSSLTIVYLSDVSDTGLLADSVWFKRGWTLQELLASHTVLFYTRDWSLYMNSGAQNHKTDPALLEELQNASGIEKQYLMDFHPGTDDARSKLHWASDRSTLRAEDIAYSLFGIFDVHLPIIYGESTQRALGRLLAEIISSSGDVSILDWVGVASTFNSCFPASLVPYQKVPHVQLIPRDPSRRNPLDLAKARKLYNDLAKLPLARCVNKRLTLPCIVHPVTMVKQKASSTGTSRYTYEIHTLRVSPVHVTPLAKLGHASTYILVRPWHPQPPEAQTDSDDSAVWELLEQLRQPFNALLLRRLYHGKEYMRVASDCMITGCVQDLGNILDSEVQILKIV